jgi:hypothetical protein
VTEVRNAYKILAAKPEGKGPLGRPRHRWKDNIKMYLKKGGLDWIHLAQDRNLWQAFVNIVMNV